MPTITDQIQTVTQAALSYVRAGLSCFPVAADGSKAPASWLLTPTWDALQQRYARAWKPFQARFSTTDEIMSWSDMATVRGQPFGLAVVCGEVSGGLEVIDLDDLAVVQPWAENVLAAAPELLDRLVLVESPRPGLHIYFRSPACDRNQWLAREQRVDPDKGQPTIVTLAETRGEGGYIMAPPSPGACHPRGIPYLNVQHDLLSIPTLTPDERNVLFNAARALNRYVEPPRPIIQRPSRPPNLDRPGDDFDSRADWPSVLEPHGWNCSLTDGADCSYWSRPGKPYGTSATTNHNGSDRLYVFSANAHPFQQNKGYSKFEAYTLLNHRGDFRAAARDLARQGYGRQRTFSAAYTRGTMPRAIQNALRAQ